MLNILTCVGMMMTMSPTYSHLSPKEQFLHDETHNLKHNCIHDKLDPSPQIMEMEVGYENHPFQEVKEGRRRLAVLDETNTKPIRIHADFSGMKETAGDARAIEKATEAMKAIVRYLGRILYVVPVVGNLKAPAIVTYNGKKYYDKCYQRVF